MNKRLLFKDYLNFATKEEIIDYYITRNHSYKDCAAHFNMGTSMFMRILKYYGIKKPNDLHTINIKKVKLDRYGSENFNNEEKRKQTNLQKYGVENQFQRQDMMEEIRTKNEEKYGSKNNIYKNIRTRAENSGSVEASYKEQIIKTRQTVLKKYGVDGTAKADIVKDTIMESLKETFNEGYDCDSYWTSEEAVRSNGSKNSHANLAFEQLLKENHIEYEKEFLLENR